MADTRFEFNFTGLKGIYAQARSQRLLTFAFTIEDGEGRFSFLIRTPQDRNGKPDTNEAYAILAMGKTLKWDRLLLLGNHLRDGNFKARFSRWFERGVKAELGLADTQREKFENWINSRRLSIAPLTRAPDGNYEHPSTQDKWEGWQAAIAANTGDFSLKDLLDRINEKIPRDLAAADWYSAAMQVREAMGDSWDAEVDSPEKNYLRSFSRLKAPKRPREKTLLKLLGCGKPADETKALIETLRASNMTTSWSEYPPTHDPWPSRPTEESTSKARGAHS